MRRMTPRLCRAVLFAVVLWTSSLKSCRCNAADCDYAESYDEIVAVSVTEPVYVTKYKWCLDIPPRCPDNKQEFRTVQKNITIPKIRTVRRCCKNQIQLYDHCIPKCTEDQCPNIQCAPGTDKCKCKSGYVGHLCRQKCDIGHWGPGCKSACDEACSDCDHRTGCCKIPAAIGDHAGLTFCVTGTPYVAATAARQTSGAAVHKNDTDRETERDVEADGLRVVRFEVQSSQTATPEPTTVLTTVTEVDGQTAAAAVVETVSAASTSAPKKRKDGGGFVQTVTKMEVTVYKYDELVKKLVWISAMTVVAIAMVFVIMFVVFFNCYGVSKVTDTPTENGRPTSTAETCLTSHNVSYIPPDRYTKTPHTSTKDDLSIHPEIFCPVFSAPHHTDESTLYDSPQPLYEILC